MKLQLIEEWNTELHRLWSLRVTLFFFALNGALIGLIAFDKVLNPVLYLALNVIGYVIVGLMRLAKQAPTVKVGPALEDGGAE